MFTIDITPLSLYTRKKSIERLPLCSSTSGLRLMTPEEAALTLIKVTGRACESINKFSYDVLRTRGGRLGSGMGTPLARQKRTEACNADPVAQSFYLFIQRNFSNSQNLNTASSQPELFE
jgi:hypothetical protein